MNATEILNALESERELLREFHELSEQQLLLLENEDLDAINHLLDQRADLMLELQAVESTLKTWVDQIKNDPQISSEILAQLRCVNDEIVQLASQVVDIDEQTHWRLDLIKERAGSGLRSLNNGSRALRGYGSSTGIGPSLSCLG